MTDRLPGSVEKVWRSERSRVLASLIRLLRDFDLAEEALHDAFLAAAEQWPRQGVPANPRSWLISAGRFKAIDKLRRRKRFAERAHLLVEPEETEMPAEPEELEDDQLRLIFTCCHPALPADAQVALTLREVSGLTTEAIASAFLARPAAIAQRIVRAKSRIRDLGLPYEVPGPEERGARFDIVMHVVYLIFNEGYAASSGPEALRADLSSEAIRLARLLLVLRPEPDIRGLLALLLLHESRRAARTDAGGGIVLLADQDRALWDRAMIAEGAALAREAFAAPPVCSYSIEAAIAATHAAAATSEATDWPRIVGLYDLLLRANPSPVVKLNRAVAVAMAEGPEAGLRLIDALLEAGGLERYRYAHAARADLLRRLGRDAAARSAYASALALTAQDAERRFLAGRMATLE